jgi:hypothetical protein
VYRFPTRHLYYPLKASNLFGGCGRIELYVFSDRGEVYPALARPTRKGCSRRFLSWNATSTVAEVSGVDPAIAELLGANAELCAFIREGPLKFEDDIWVGTSPSAGQ